MFIPTPNAGPEGAEARRVQRLSALLALGCGALMVALPLAVPVYWALADVSGLAARAGLHAADVQGALLVWQRCAGALIGAVPALLAAVGLARARRCFADFARGQVFTLQAVHGLRLFAAWTGASAVAALLAVPLLSVVLTWGNAPGTRHVVLALGSDHLFTALFAAIVWLMAAVIGQGRALAEENAGFV